MSRYSFLGNDEIYEALNRLRDAFLAANDGNEVTEIMNGLLTDDEKIRIGRRIIIADALRNDHKYKSIVSISNTGYTTVAWVAKQINAFPKCFELILKRRRKMEKEYRKKQYKKQGGSLLIFKKRVYSGAKRSDIKR